jgi:hypothetical protein
MAHCQVHASYGTMTSACHLAMCHAVPRPVQHINISYSITTSVFQLSMCHAVPQPVYFNWQCVMGTTTSALHLTMCHTGWGTAWHIVRCKALVVVPHSTLPGEIHWLWYRIANCQLKYTGCGTASIYLTVPQPVYFSCQCVMRYHNQCISTGNVLCGTTTSALHLTMCHAVPQPVYFNWQFVHWLWYRIANYQLKYTVCGTSWHIVRCKALDQCISTGNMLCGTTTNVFHLAVCYAVPQSVYFTWQCVMRYHNQCISAGNVASGCGTAWHIAMWMSLVMVPYDTLPGERHWTW